MTYPEEADDAPKPNDESRTAGRPLFQLTAYLAEKLGDNGGSRRRQAKDDSPANRNRARTERRIDTAEAKPAEAKKPDEKPPNRSRLKREGRRDARRGEGG